LLQVLKDAGIPASAYAAEGKNHTTLNDDLGTVDDKPTKALFEFVSRIVKPGAAGDTKDEATKKDRKRMEGTWRATALIVNGETFTQENANALTVVNGADGTWIIRDRGTEKSKGTSTIDPTENPKTIDITPSVGDDKGITYLGIYELGENTRKVCVAPPGKARPKDFTSTAGSGHILVTFERVKDK
jgi:uncharacterized protein (TIGR03067 family)